MKQKTGKNTRKYYELEESESNLIIHFSDNFVVSNARFYNQIKTTDFTKKFKSIKLDFSGVTLYDSFLVSYISSLKLNLAKLDITFEITGMSADLESFYNYLSRFTQSSKDLALRKDNFIFRWIEKFGKKIQKIVTDGFNFISFIGEVLAGLLKTFFSPGKIRWEDLPAQIIKIGVSAVPISLLIVFLIGLVTGYQGALQLKIFGADIYIADLISVSLTRELAPLMVAIIIAGRSGSAFTAEIGTMKLSEEIDALKVMGFNITDFIVMPRLLAAMIAVPIIVILADLSGILGGLVATLTTLDLTPAAYFNRMQEALFVRDIFSGLIKSEIFAIFITIIGCFRGMQVSGGADSVGHYTTSSVVTSIFHIVIIDSIFTLIFPILGI